MTAFKFQKMLRGLSAVRYAVALVILHQRDSQTDKLTALFFT